MSLVGLLLSNVLPSQAKPRKPALRIMPTAQGNGNGSSWANAGSLSNLNSFIQQAAAINGDVWIRADAGEYNQNTSRSIDKGGSLASPVVVRGCDVNGDDMLATLKGTRMVDTSGTRLWNAKTDTANGVYGNEVFRLNSGANNLEFSFIDFLNQGRGCFRVREPLSNLVVRDCTARNVAGFFVNDAASNAVGATIDGLKILRCSAKGYSKFFAAIKWDSRNILIEDCLGDSQRQDGDNFASGIIFDHTAHDIIVRRSTMNNHIDTLHRYQNGDGMAGERNNYNILLEDCVTNNNTDGGIDFKSDFIVIVRHYAEGNHRNYRLWGFAKLIDSIGIEPIDNAGFNPYAKANIGVFEGCMVIIIGGRYTQTGTQAVIRCEKGSMCSLSTTTVIQKPSSTAVYYTEGSVGDIPAAQFQMMPANDKIPATITSPLNYTIDENKAGQWPFTFNKFAQLKIKAGLDSAQFALTGYQLDMYKQDYDPPVNTRQRKVYVYSVDGSGNLSEPVLVTININDVADDPISPEELKALGVTKGAWVQYDPAFCWQDVDATIPADVGDPVARVTDRFGFGNDLILEDGGTPAILTKRGLYYCLARDGFAGPYKIGAPGYFNFPEAMFVQAFRRDGEDKETRYLFTVPRSLAAGVDSNFRFGMSFVGGASFSIKVAPTTTAGGVNSYTSPGTGAQIGVTTVLAVVSKTAVGLSNGQQIIDGADRTPMTYGVNGQARIGSNAYGTQATFMDDYGFVFCNISPDPNVSSENAIIFRVSRQLAQLAGKNI